MNTTTFDYEYTDTFAGEANYSWVKRGKVTVKDDPVSYGPALRRAKRAAKAAVGLSGVRGEWQDQGSNWAFKPYGSCTILFLM